MDKEKRVRARAIIFHEDKIISMYRELNDRIFYTFPGGGIEGEESVEECVKREVFEEFGIVIKPIKKVYMSENQISISHYFICEWVRSFFESALSSDLLIISGETDIPKSLEFTASSAVCSNSASVAPFFERFRKVST
jgi:8-oxo-dGTP pyrophosphatase MutT (NUDIX family)